MECHVLSWSACGEGAGCGPFGRGARIVPPAGWPFSAWRFPPAAVPFRRCEAPPRRDPGFRAYPARGRAGVCVGAVRAPDRPREAGDARLPSAESGSFGLRAGAGGRRSARTPPLSDPSYHGFSCLGPEKEKHYRNFMNICRSLSRPLTLPSRKRERSIHTSGLNFGLIGRWRLHIVAPDPDPGPISGPFDLPERRKGSAAEGVPRFREGRRWGRPRNRFRSTTAGITAGLHPFFACSFFPPSPAREGQGGRPPLRATGVSRRAWMGSGDFPGLWQEALQPPAAGRCCTHATGPGNRRPADCGRGEGRAGWPCCPIPDGIYRKEFGMRKALPNAGRTMGIMGNCCV